MYNSQSLHMCQIYTPYASLCMVIKPKTRLSSFSGIFEICLSKHLKAANSGQFCTASVTHLAKRSAFYTNHDFFWNSFLLVAQDLSYFNPLNHTYIHSYASIITPGAYMHILCSHTCMCIPTHTHTEWAQITLFTALTFVLNH